MFDDNASDGELLEYKTGNERDENRPPVPTLNDEVTIPLKYLTNFWRFHNLLLINCEIELD